MKLVDIDIDHLYDDSIKLHLTVKSANMDHLNAILAHHLNGKQVDVILEKHKEKRSLDSNAYLWVLLQKMAEKLLTTKNELYQLAVREAGAFEYVAVLSEHTKEFIDRHNNSSLGNFADDCGKSKTLPNMHTIRCYHGSSTYNQSEMNHLLNYVVEEAKSLGIETMPPDELERLVSKWQRNIHHA